MALAERGLRCVFASDIDEHARRVYEANFGLRPEGDITKIAAEDIPPHDVLCAGFPCQPFSLANKDAAGFDDTRGTLFFEIARIAAHHRPKILLLENVPRILSFDKGKVLAKIISTLDELGYKTAWHKLNAAEYGCATARRRVYFVAIRKDLKLVSNEPAKTAERDCVANHLRPDLDTKSLERPIGDYVFGEHGNPSNNPQGTKLIARHKEARRDHRQQGGRVYSVDGAMPTLTCSNGEHILAPAEPERIGEHRDKGNMQGYRVYSTDGPAPTLSADGGGQLPSGGYLVPAKAVKLGNRKGNPKRAYDRVKQPKGGGHSRGYGLYDADAPAPTIMCDKGEAFLIRVGGHRKYPNSVGARIYDPAGAAVSFNASCGGKFGRTGGYLIEGVVRRLHVLEALTIQGFPAEHVVSEGGQGYKQIGNSVIPRMIGLVFDSIAEAVIGQEALI